MSRQHSGNKIVQASKQFQDIPKQQVQSDQRLIIMENNLNRVSLQLDALMPLLMLIEYIPSIQRSDQMMKQLQKKMEDAEIRIQNQEKLKEKQQKETSLGMDKKSQKALLDLSERVAEMDNQLLRLSRLQDTKQDTSQNVLKCIENRQQQGINSNSIQDMIKSQFVSMRMEFQSEFKNIYREIGGLRNDLEFIINEDKKRKMTSKVQLLGPGLSNEDRVYLINLLEQESFIEDLEMYEKENTFRVNYEMEFMLMVIKQINIPKKKGT